MKKTIYILAFLAVSFTAGAQALPFTAVDYDPVAMGKGGTFLTETSSSCYAVFGNPAAVPFGSGTADWACSYTVWQPSGAKSDIMTTAASYLIRKKIGVSLGVSYGKGTPYDIVDASGMPGGSFTPDDLQARLGLSWKFLPFLSVGANVGYASSRLAEGASYGAMTADVFAMAKFSGLKATAGVRGLGTAVKSVSGASFSLPVAVVAGVGYELALGEKSLVDVNVDAQYHIEGGVAVAGGASYTFARLATVRAGYRYGGDTVIPSYASVGVGVALFGAHIDFAYLIAGKDSPMAGTLCLSAGWGF